MRNASSVSAHVSTWLIMMAWHRGCWRRSRAAWRPSKAREQCYSWSAASIRSSCAWASWRLSSLNEDVCQACKSATLSSPSSLTRLTTVTSYNCHVLQVLQVSRATSWEAVHSELLRGCTLWATALARPGQAGWWPTPIPRPLNEAPRMKQRQREEWSLLGRQCAEMSVQFISVKWRCRTNTGKSQAWKGSMHDEMR